MAKMYQLGGKSARRQLSDLQSKPKSSLYLYMSLFFFNYWMHLDTRAYQYFKSAKLQSQIISNLIYSQILF